MAWESCMIWERGDVVTPDALGSLSELGLGLQGLGLTPRLADHRLGDAPGVLLLVRFLNVCGLRHASWSLHPGPRTFIC